MSVRRAAFKVGMVALLLCAGGFGLGTYTARRVDGAREAQDDARFNALRAELARSVGAISRTPLGTAGTAPSQADASTLGSDPGGRAALVEQIKRELQAEMGLLPLRVLRERRDSFVEMNTTDNHGGSSYGTAGYLGHGYFITVKHGVVAFGTEADPSREPRRIVAVKLMYRQRALRATVVDAGEAEVEVDPGDWAILRVNEKVNLPPLRVDFGYGFDFADPIFRLGNDYSKGIILATGYVGQRTQNGLVTCLTDGHPGVSGGGVLNRDGSLVGIPVGRMQGDYRFSFILPVRREMFRNVPVLQLSGAPETLTQ